MVKNVVAQTDGIQPQGEMSNKNYLDTIMDVMIKSQTDSQNLFNRNVPEPVTRRTIETDKPIALLLASDIHFGSVYTDYQKLKEIWDWVIETEGIYICVVGDFIDNFDAPVPKLLMAGINSQLLPPDAQRLIYKTYLKVLQERGKIVSMVLGNHEAFSSFDLWFEGDLNFPIHPNRQYLWLTVGEQLYKIALIHKSRYNSFLNPNHSNLREMNINYPEADVIVTSHTHMAATQIIQQARDGIMTERLFIKTGSLKHDPYAYQFFCPSAPNSDLGITMVTLSPNKRSMRQMPFYDAIEHILWSREKR